MGGLVAPRVRSLSARRDGSCTQVRMWLHCRYESGAEATPTVRQLFVLIGPFSKKFAHRSDHDNPSPRRQRSLQKRSRALNAPRLVSPRGTPAGLVILDIRLIPLLVCFDHMGPIVLRTAGTLGELPCFMSDCRSNGRKPCQPRLASVE